MMTYTSGGTATWYAWQQTGTHCTSTATTDQCWQSWAGGGTATTTNVFRIWSTAGNSTTAYEVNRITPPPANLTPEEIEARRVVLEESRRRAEAAQREHEKQTLAAQKAALKLYLGIIGRKAYASWKRRGYHEIIAHSGKRYRLAIHERVKEMAGNFGDQIVAYYCIHSGSEYRLPAVDVLVQQLLLLMAGEQGEALLKKTANRTEAA